MSNILLGVTGSVAAIKTPDLLSALRARGHEVRVVATRAALYFFDPAGWPDGTLATDDDEWPRRSAGERYQREDPVLHIELRRWADALVIAPMDANTLGKLASGLADNCLTCVARAWDVGRPVIVAPAMNTHMWEHPATRRQLAQLAADYGVPVTEGSDLDAILEAAQSHAGTLTIVAPQVKELACGDIGLGAMADVEAIVFATQAALSLV
ncbi:MAG: flavoprotein [Planctomycetia bacterium]|nr:flavoprotein [Planctomycetia bacterium]